MRGNPVRKQVLVISAVAVLVAVGAVVWYVLTQRHVSSMLAEGVRTNMLCIGRGGVGEADAFTLLSLAGEDVVFFSLPRDVRVKRPDGVVGPLGGVYLEFGASAAARATAALLGIDVRFFLVGGRRMVEDWIDSLGGVTVAIVGEALYQDASVEPPLRVEIRGGERTMSGSDAMAFALSPGLSGDVGLLARQQSLVRALLAQGLRTAPTRALHATIRRLFPDLETNCTLQDLLEAAEVMRHMPDDRVRMVALPTETFVLDGEALVEPRIVETERVVASVLKGLDLLTPDEIHVAVFNGNGVREMASRTAQYLRARGFSVVWIGNADSFDYSPTYIVVLTDEARAWLLRDALPRNEIRIVFPETFEAGYAALREFIPVGTDLLLIAGIGMEL